ncbi:hypothetical protein JJV70_05705 [Streptomyces sp. JJ66]|uniref:hypothetical protein n=1 Tax=Streptomyces sp. JJ66 TaxID=2803843 RepID=UPI001C58F25F|nr:hypothetical protein [Streptomyces sp. JJ66]MBW1601611.1 hypothetical protein [Streptomyces sp. JJ66]
MSPDATPEVWQQLFALAEQRPPSASPASSPDGTSPSPLLALASADGGAPEGGKLRHSAGPWTSASNSVDGMANVLAQAKNKLETSHENIAAEGAGLASVSKLTKVRETWVERLESAREECENLAPKLRAVAKEHGENEAATTSTFKGAQAPTGAEGGR